MLTTRVSLIVRLRDTADEESWAEFVRLYKPLLRGYVRRKGLREHDAEDVVQEALIHLVRALPGFELDHGRGRFRTFLWCVTNNAVVDWLRKRQRRAKYECTVDEQLAIFEQAADSEPDEQWVKDEQKRIAAVAIEEVRKQTRDNTWACFQRHILERQPAAETGEELGMQPNAVYVNACRVMAKVREKCLEYEG